MPAERIVRLNAPPPADYEGRVVCFEVLRLGDHAHMEVSTGRQHASGPGRDPTYHKGGAGHLVFAWEDWLHFRDALDAIPWVFLAEVENPTPEQLDRYTANPESRLAIAEQQQAKLRAALKELRVAIEDGIQTDDNIAEALRLIDDALAATTEDPQ